MNRVSPVSTHPSFRPGAFTLIELLVVISIIGLLVAILLPVMSLAKKQAAYAAWAGYSHELAMSPELGIYYNMQNKDTNGRVANMSGMVTDGKAYDAADCDAQFYSLFGGTGYVKASPDFQKKMWTDGRWSGKPAFNSGAAPVSFLSNATPFVSNFSNKLYSAQQLTVSVWAYVPAQNQTTSAFYWQGTNGGPTVNIQLGYDSTTSYYAGGIGVDNSTVAYPVANSKTWTHWVFTKDFANGASNQKIYMNGKLIKTTSPCYSALGDLNSTLATDVGYHDSSMVIGKIAGGQIWNGAIDEFGMWNRTLSDDEIAQMYKAGSNF